MAEDGSGRSSDAKAGTALASVAVIAAACCAALPLLVAIVGGVAVWAVVGAGAGVVATVGLIAMVIGRTRKRRNPRPARSGQINDEGDLERHHPG